MSTIRSINGLHQLLWCGHQLGKFGPGALPVAQGRTVPFFGTDLHY
jgi:hypothetical protein